MSIIVLRRRPHKLYKKIQERYEVMDVWDKNRCWQHVSESSSKYLTQLIKQETSFDEIATISWPESLVYIMNYANLYRHVDTHTTLVSTYPRFNLADPRLKEEVIRVELCNAFILDLSSVFVLLHALHLFNQERSLQRIVLANALTDTFQVSTPCENFIVSENIYEGNICWENEDRYVVYLPTSDYEKVEDKIIGPVEKMGHLSDIPGIKRLF